MLSEFLQYWEPFDDQDIEKLPKEIKGIYSDGDIIITMGAGDIYKQNDIIFEAIK